MSRIALLGTLAAMALVSGASRAVTVVGQRPASSIDSAPSAATGFIGVSPLSQISRQDPDWASDGSAFVNDPVFASPSPAAQTELWALTPEPATWTILLLGLSGVGASVRARRRALPVRPHAKIKGKR